MISKTKVIAVAVVNMALCASVAVAAGPSLFGIELGAKLEDIPKCTRNDYGVIDDRPETLCLQAEAFPFRGQEAEAMGYETYLFELPANKPSYLNVLEIYVLDGKVGSIVAKTGGIEDQEEAFKALRAKFGAPRKSNYTPVQNRMGAKFRRIQADWKAPNATLFFYGAYAVDAGLIGLESNEFSARRAAAEKQRKKTQLAP